MPELRPKPVVLIILDGWGVAPFGDGNALALARHPVLDKLIFTYPAMTIAAASDEVGLSWGEMGNSEVGHLNIGAGRVYYQTLPRINKSIESGEFLENKVFLEAAEHVKKNNSRLHLLGLVSPGGVHSHENHLYALLQFAVQQNLTNVFVHAIIDGRDTIYNAGAQFINGLENKMRELKVGKIASLSGRFWAMDRDNRWERIQQAYRAMVDGESAENFKNSIQALTSSYAKKVYDEDFAPTVITEGEEPIGRIQDGDAVVFFNFRPDRARELTQAFVSPAFNRFPRTEFKNLFFAIMTEYEKGLPVAVAFPPEVITTCLAKVISDAGLKQLHIAETEKYAHVTFFLNGTIEEPFPGEDRVIIPSPRVASYNQAPAMATLEIAARVVKEIESDKYDFIAVNFANGDMVGHTGDIEATIKGAEVVDEGIGKIVEAVLAKDGAALITADHGNAEEVLNLQTGVIDKEHSTNPVPLIVVGKKWTGQVNPTIKEVAGDLSLIASVGVLADVTPTILNIMGIPQPPEMTGRPLI